MPLANLRCQGCLKTYEMSSSDYPQWVGKACECGHPLWTAEEQEISDIITRNEAAGVDSMAGMTPFQVKVCYMWAIQSRAWKLIDAKVLGRGNA